MTKKELEEYVETLKIQIRHLENDFLITKEDYENSAANYIEILSELNKKNIKLIVFQKNLEKLVDQRTKEVHDLQEILLSKSDEQQVMLDLSPALIFYLDNNKKFIRVNKLFSEFFELSFSEIIGSPADKILPNYIECFSDDFEEVIERGYPVSNKTMKIFTGGKLRWIRMDIFSNKGITGSHKGIIGFALDITDQKQAEEAMIESEEKFRNLVETSQDLIFRVNTEGKFTYLNPAWENTLKYKIDEMIDKKFTDFKDPEVAKRDIKQFEKGLAGSPAVGFETTYISKTGEDVYLIINTIPLVDLYGNIVGVQGCAYDITNFRKAEEESRQLKEQLLHSQKMESIGIMAGGIAHDFNNILMGISGYAESLKLKAKKLYSVAGVEIDNILKATERGSDLTKQLLGFARKGKYNPIPTNINRIIEESVMMSEKIFKKNIKVTLDLEENIGHILADNTQMNQVITNLLINANDAMPSGGKIIIKTENIIISKKTSPNYADISSGKFVKFSLTDTGVGINNEIMDKIFDPFYTTKEPGKGTGLGLATVYGIIENHNGKIIVSSKLGKGSTFTAILPECKEKEVIKDSQLNITKGNAKILVVDDEESLCDLFKSHLEILGYKVITAVDGLDAVKKYKKHKNNIDLVLLDIIMPNLSGRETTKILKVINENVKIVYISGYAEMENNDEYFDDNVIGFIQKPYKISELSETISNALKL